VELGTHAGVSYTAFCQSVANAGFNTRCVAVDTWRGDKQSGIYGEEVYSDLKEFHDARYADFSTLLRCTFDDALACFSEGSVDILHIDGLHTYDAVRHDFDVWFPKLSNRAVILLHDTNEHQPDFDVWRLWAEISERFSCFEFLHSHGLGVLAAGSDVPPAIAELCGLRDPTDIVRVRRRFAVLGERWIAEMHQRQSWVDASTASGAAAEAHARAEAAYRELKMERAGAEAAYHELKTERAGAEAAAAELDVLRHQLKVEQSSAATALDELRQQLERQRAECLALQLSNERAEQAYAFMLRQHTESQEQLTKCREQLTQSREQLTQSREQLMECQEQLAESRGHLAEFREQLDGCRQQLAEYQERGKKQEHQITLLRTSNSWRLTAPFRAISRAISGRQP
jgi:hypothetical protein